MAIEADSLDWRTVTDFARRHRLQPFVWRSLTEAEVPIPPAVRDEWEHTIDALVRRNLYMIAELAAVINRLEAAGVRVLTYKGPTLAELAYGDSTRREFDDLDLLVPEEDFHEAVAVLRSGNFEVDASFPAFGEVTLIEQETGLPIDLHFRVTPTRYPFAFPFEELWERRVEVTVCGNPVQTFSPMDLLPVIAVHGTRHYWTRLEWLLSFAALCQKNPMDVAYGLDRSTQRGCDRMVRLGLNLSRELLGLTIPEDIACGIDEDLLVRLVARRVISNVVGEEVNVAKDNRAFHYERYFVQFLLMRGAAAKGIYGKRVGHSLLSNKLDSVKFVLS